MTSPPDFEVAVGLRARELEAQVPPDPQTEATGEGVSIERAENRRGLPAELSRGVRYDEVVVEKRVVGEVEGPAG